MLIEDEHLEGKRNRLSLWTVMCVVFVSFSFIITVQLRYYVSIPNII